MNQNLKIAKFYTDTKRTFNFSILRKNHPFYNSFKYLRIDTSVTSQLRKYLQSGLIYRKTRLLKRLIVPLIPTIEKPRDASTNCNDTAVTAIDSTDQSNASPQTSPIRWKPLPRPDKRDPFDSGSSR